MVDGGIGGGRWDSLKVQVTTRGRWDLWEVKLITGGR